MESKPRHTQSSSNPRPQPESSVWFREHALPSHEIIVSLTSAESSRRSSSVPQSPAPLEAISGREPKRSIDESTNETIGNDDDDDDEDEDSDKEQQTKHDDEINAMYTSFSEGLTVKGILCPSLSNSFHSHSLERSYLTYSHRQRQKSLIIVNVVDMLVKVILAVVYVWPQNTARVSELFMFSVLKVSIICN